jgi:hypothetical protein
MKSGFGSLCVTVLVTCALAAQDSSTTRQDAVAVERAAYDYADGYLSGAAERMARAVHPAIVKRGLLSRPGMGLFLTPMNAETLVELTGQRAADPTPADKRSITFALLDLRGDVASAKIFTSGFDDYLHLVKQDGTWRLVNVLWSPPKPDAAANTDSDKAAVAQTVREYYDALAAFDPARLERVIHPEAALRNAVDSQRAGKIFVVEGNRESLLERARAKVIPPLSVTPAITVLDTYDNTASVLVTTGPDVSYWHLARQNGQWRLVNRLSRPARAAAGT